MLEHTRQIGLLVMVLGLLCQDATAFGRCGGSGRNCGGASYGNGAYGGYCYGSYDNYRYYGSEPSGCAASPNGGYPPPAISPTSLPTSAPPRVSNSVQFKVNVPASAKVFVNNRPTTSTGEDRTFTSTGLQPAQVYLFRVRAEFVRQGKSVIEEKTIQLTAGQRGSLAFGTSPAQVASIKLHARH